MRSFSSQVSTLGRHAALHPAARPTRPRRPPGPSGNQVCRGSGFAGECGFAEKSGPAGNRDPSENVVRAYAWPAQQRWSRYWDRLCAYPSVWMTLYPTVWSTSQRYPTFCACNEYTLLSAVSSSRSSAYTYHQSWQPALANFTRAREGDGEQTGWTWGDRIIG